MHSLALGEISTPITKGATPTTYGFEWQASGVPFLRSECVSEKGLDMRQSMFISSEAHASLQRSQVVEGDILLTITGNIGRVVQLEGIEEANINQHIARVRVIDDRLHPRYVFHYLSQRAVRQYYESITTGQAYPQISLAQVRSTAIPLISKIEQKEIVAALDDADMLISSLEHLISKKQAIKQGMMQELLTGRTRLAGFTAPWTDIVLGDVSRFSKGSGLPKSALTTSGSTPCIHYGELFTSYGPEILHVKSRTNLADRTVVSEDLDVLMPTSDVTPRGLAKASSIHGRGVVLGGDILIIRPDAIRAYGPFLAHVIRRDADQVLKLVRGSTVYHLYASDMQNFTLAIPSVEEQRAIADALLAAECEIEALRLRLTKAREIKTGMMQELLTGRTRLPVEEVSS